MRKTTHIFGQHWKLSFDSPGGFFDFWEKPLKTKESGKIRRQLAADFSATKRTVQNWAVPENRPPQFWGDVSSFGLIYAPPGCSKELLDKNDQNLQAAVKRWKNGFFAVLSLSKRWVLNRHPARECADLYDIKKGTAKWHRIAFYCHRICLIVQ